MATSAFQNITRGWVSNACLFNSRSLLSLAKDSISDQNFQSSHGEISKTGCDEVGLGVLLEWEAVGASGIGVHLAKGRGQALGYKILLHIFGKKKIQGNYIIIQQHKSG